jgi:uncharacterized protein YegP (UPF0339 family)
MITYVRIMGPPVMKAIRALEKLAIEQPEVCIMNSIIAYDLPTLNIDDTFNYFSPLGSIDKERCDKIISKSGVGLGEYDFFFEWFKEPSNSEFVEFIQNVDDALEPTGVRYALTTRGAKKLHLDVSQVEIRSEDVKESASGGYFEVYRGKDDQWRFRLKAPNHKIIAVSEAYPTKEGCLNGVKSVRENSQSEVYDLTE